jgi:hypothetical protein
MDLPSTYTIGIFCFLFGAAASQLPPSKERNISRPFPLSGATTPAFLYNGHTRSLSLYGILFHIISVMTGVERAGE